MQLKVLVMGGTQFNGLALVHELVRAGHDVTVCNRGRSEADLPAGVKRLVADRTDHDTLRSVIGGTDWDCVQDITAYHPPDVEVMIDILAGHVGHYIFASSTVIYAAKDGPPITEFDPVDRSKDQNEYGLHKILCEDLLLEAHAQQGFPATIAAFSMVFGPHNTIRDREQRMFCRLLQDRPILMPGDGTTLLQVGHVDDQARALEQLMGRSLAYGKRYNLTGSEAVSRNQYIATMAEVTGCTPTIVNIPAPMMDDLWTGSVPLESGEANMGMNVRTSSSTNQSPRAQMLRQRFQLAQLVQHLAPGLHWWNSPAIFSIERLQTDIGWAPRHDFESMTRHTYEWFVSAGLDSTSEYDWTLEDQILRRVDTGV